jgi:hypothetical protein
LANDLYSFSWGGLLDEILDNNNNDSCSNVTNPVIPNCQDAQVDKQMVMKLLRGCKADPENGDHSWVCDEPTRQEATDIKKATFEVFDAICRENTVPESNDACLANQIYSFSWGGQLSDTQSIPEPEPEPTLEPLGGVEGKWVKYNGGNKYESVTVSKDGKTTNKWYASWEWKEVGSNWYMKLTTSWGYSGPMWKFDGGKCVKTGGGWRWCKV